MAKIAEHGQNVCPGSIFVPMTDGRCICGNPRERHVWEHAGAGAMRRIEEQSYEDAAAMREP